MKKKITIIGRGRFGELVNKIISDNFPNFSVEIAKGRDIENYDFAGTDVVIPCVPIRAFENVIKQISPKLKPNTIVIDVCSVKVYPVKIMKKYLRDDIQIIATHPLFGPDSTRNGLTALPIMVYNVSANEKVYSKVKNYCKDLSLKLVEITPEEHDQFMAYSQAYTHFVGRIGKELSLKPTPIDTLGFKQTLKIQQYVVNDTEELFIDMHKYNPYSKAMRKRFLKAASKLDSKIGLS